MATYTPVAKTKLESVIGLSKDGEMLISGEELWKRTETGKVVAERRRPFADGSIVKEICLEIEAPNGSSNGRYCQFVFPQIFLGKLAGKKLVGKTVWIGPRLLRWEHRNRSYRVEKNGVSIKLIGRINGRKKNA